MGTGPSTSHEGRCEQRAGGWAGTWGEGASRRLTVTWQVRAETGQEERGKYFKIIKMSHGVQTGLTGRRGILPTGVCRVSLAAKVDGWALLY